MGRWKLAEGTRWRDKLRAEHPNHGKIVRVPLHMQKRFGRGTMLIPKPGRVDALIAKVRKGQLLTQVQLREKLAEEAGADCACPLTTGLFLRIVAEAAEEALREGRKRVTPYWRVVKDDGSLNERFPGGAPAQARRLRAEGFAVVARKGRRGLKVKDVQRYLVP